MFPSRRCRSGVRRRSQAAYLTATIVLEEVRAKEVNEVTIPGFTAGSSLYWTGQYWQDATGRSDLAGGLSIIPQAKVGCWTEKSYQEVADFGMIVVWCTKHCVLPGGSAVGKGWHYYRGTPKVCDVIYNI
jgi:hypothetical protein